MMVKMGVMSGQYSCVSDYGSFYTRGQKSAEGKGLKKPGAKLRLPRLTPVKLYHFRQVYFYMTGSKTEIVMDE